MGSVDEHGVIAPPERLWESTSWLLGHVAGDAHRLLLENMTAADRTDYAALSGLDEFGPITQAALGRRLGIDRSDISAVVERLESHEYITRIVDPSHRSRKIVEPTTAGRKHLRRLETQVRKTQDQLLAPLDPTDAEKLTELLQRLVIHHRHYHRADGAPSSLGGHPHRSGVGQGGCSPTGDIQADV